MSTTPIETTIFGRRVTAERERLGWSRAKLAGESDVVEKTIWRWEKGATEKVSLDDAASVAQALGVSLDYLAGRTPEAR